MADEIHERSRTEERTLLDDLDKLIPMVLEMDSQTQQISDYSEEMMELTEKLNLLKARQARVTAERQEISVTFWRAARLQDPAWFRRMRETGFCVHVEKIKDNDNHTMGLKVCGHNSSQDVLAHIKGIF